MYSTERSNLIGKLKTNKHKERTPLLIRNRMSDLNTNFRFTCKIDVHVKIFAISSGTKKVLIISEKTSFQNSCARRHANLFKRVF